MTTLTFDTLSSVGFRAMRGAKRPGFDIRAALPDMPTDGTALARALEVATGAAMAAVPFAVLGWLFIAR